MLESSNAGGSCFSVTLPLDLTLSSSVHLDTETITANAARAVFRAGGAGGPPIKTSR